jgi:protein TonB
MFEDSTFESACRIHTRSRRWMIAVFLFNISILLALVLIPLICPEALPRQAIAFLMEAPAPQPAPQTLPKPTMQMARPATEILNGHIIAPSMIPIHIFKPSGPEPPIAISIVDPGIGNPSGLGQPFSGPATRPVVRPANNGPMRVSSKTEEELLIHKTMPVYPAIGVAARVEGTVMLAATISKTGTIENLRVTSGPALLQQAALDAVKTWHYRPYLLDDQPVEVETTVNVIFTLSR